FIRAMVGSDERFISSEPSPSNATILRPGRPSAMPNAIDEQSPSVRTRKLLSPGRKEFHSKVIAPAELTMSASPMTGARALRQSNRFMTNQKQRNPILCYKPDLSAGRRPSTSLVNNSATGRFESSAKV